MKSSAYSRLFCTILLLLLSWTNVFAQFDLGPNGLVDAPAPTLKDPGRIGLRSPGYVGKVGGVAFGATAKPAKPRDFTNLMLSYRPKESDGNRLWVTADGQQFIAPLHDWQFVPIAKFADSPHKSCVTLFGELEDHQEAKRVRRNGGWIINYHPAFVDTLLGLRLFQFDLLITDRAAAELPSQNGKYILGAGEGMPDVKANAEAWDAVADLRRRFSSVLRVEPRSYVITDEEVDVRFSLGDGGLSITGEPYFYFWQFKRNLRDYDAGATYKKIIDEVNQEAHSLIGASGGNPAAERAAYISVLLKQLKQSEHYYAEGYYNSTAPPRYVTELINMKSDLERREYVKDYPVDFIRGVIARLRYYADGYTVVPLAGYSARISRDTEMMRHVNPNVWDAGVNVMRYAAFFRYYKEKYPARWRAFLTRIDKVPVVPQVQTPTIMKGSR